MTKLETRIFIGLYLAIAAIFYADLANLW